MFSNRKDTTSRYSIIHSNKKDTPWVRLPKVEEGWVKVKSIVEALDWDWGADEGGRGGDPHGSTRVCKEQCEDDVKYGMDILFRYYRSDINM